MKRDLRFVLVSLLFVAMSALVAFGQETTGVIEITAKDANGAIVPNVTFTVASTGQSTGYKRTITTDDSGFVRLNQVPPGTYSVTAAATAGFKVLTLTGINVGLGQATPVSFTMAIGTGDIVVDVTSSNDVNPIDVTDTKIQTTINAQTAELLPKGLNIDSIFKFSPAARQDARSGTNATGEAQFQIDGASGSENTFIIDGQEVTNSRTGALDSNSKLPFALVQEVQIKSSGFEAEYGGATGGVINVVTKGGSNSLRGEFGINLRTSRIEPIDRFSLRNNAGVPEWYPARRDQYNETSPGASVGGPILKDRIWFFASYAPQLYSRTRTLVFRDQSTRVPTGRVETYHAKQRKEASFARIDAQPFTRLRLTGTLNWNPITRSTNAFSAPGYSNELNPSFASAVYFDQTGGRQNSMNFTGQGVYSLTNNLIISGRLGHYFLNEKLTAYGQGDRSNPTINCAAQPSVSQQFPANFGCQRGTGNGVPGVSATEYDVTARNQYDLDATYSFSMLGRHEIKGGYQYNGISNNVSDGNNDQITLRWGTGPLNGVGAISGHAGMIPSAPGATGSGALTLFETKGNVSSKNEAFYVQDKWQPTRRLTLNLGFRTERENVPSYAAGLPGIDFSFSSKIAPRLGAAYDLTGDGKTKVSAFYGLFYDRFKLELPRGSFGGDLFHTVYFDLFATDNINTINRDTVFGAGGLATAGGACPLGTQTPVVGRVRCDKDFRVPSNTGGPLTQVGGIDPNIKPFQQREVTFTFERQLTKIYSVSARYTRKQVLHAIEDAGFPNESGSEYYIIGNPGEGLYKEQADMFGTLALKPQRQYDAFELRLDRRFANHFFFNASYTYSRLYGNYAGLSSSDENGRPSPNVNRNFDQPHAGFTVAGGPDNGLLGTDRPHEIKFYGTYSLNWNQFGLWKANTTDFEVFTTASSGSVITTFITLNDISQIVLDKRGDQGRTPTFTQTDFALRHSIKFGKDGRFTLRGDVDILNVFNEYVVTLVGPTTEGLGNIINVSNFNVLTSTFGLITPAQSTACGLTASPGQCRLITAYATFQRQGSPALAAAARDLASRSPLYNQPSAFQGKRNIRYGLRFIF